MRRFRRSRLVRSLSDRGQDDQLPRDFFLPLALEAAAVSDRIFERWVLVNRPSISSRSLFFEATSVSRSAASFLRASSIWSFKSA